MICHHHHHMMFTKCCPIMQSFDWGGWGGDYFVGERSGSGVQPTVAKVRNFPLF